jgi:hypothetical protein
MPQVFQMISGPMVQELLSRRDNRLDTLVAAERTNQEIVDELFWTVLSRCPTPIESDTASNRLNAASDRRGVAEDLMWALLNSKEFVFRR